MFSKIAWHGDFLFSSLFTNLSVRFRVDNIAFEAFFSHVKIYQIDYPEDFSVATYIFVVHFIWISLDIKCTAEDCKD